MATALENRPVAQGGGLQGSTVQRIRQAAGLLRASVAAVGSLAAEDVVELAPLFADAARIAQAGTLRCARVAGDQGARRFAGERSAASLLSSVSKTTLGRAKAGLDAAEKLGAVPAAERALWHGDLSLDQAATIAPVAVEAPEAATSLVDAAPRSSMKELKEAAARTLRTRRSEAAVVEGERRMHHRRYCRTWVEDDGAVRLEALLGPATGAQVLGALDRETRHLDRERRRVGQDLSAEQVRADALATLLAGAALKPGGGDRSSARRTSAAGSGATTAAGPQVLVRVDAAALQRGSVTGDEMCEIAGIGPVSVRIARELLCEGFLTLLVTEGADVRTVTSTTRSVPARVERALLLRDVRCVVPGCGATERLEIDHWRQDFSWRGRTELTNLCRLCPAHHAMKTRTGWQLAGGPGRWRWMPPKTVPELARRHGTSYGSRPRKLGPGPRAGGP